MVSVFFYDHLEVEASGLSLRRSSHVLPHLLSQIVPQAFDQRAAPTDSWPVRSKRQWRRGEGIVRPVAWNSGNRGLIPAVSADLSLEPVTPGLGLIEVSGTFRFEEHPESPEVQRLHRYQSMAGMRRLLHLLAEGLTQP